MRNIYLKLVLLLASFLEQGNWVYKFRNIITVFELLIKKETRRWHNEYCHEKWKRQAGLKFRARLIHGSSFLWFLNKNCLGILNTLDLAGHSFSGKYDTLNSNLIRRNKIYPLISLKILWVIDENVHAV